MRNTYVKKHNWGSFESDSTINKLYLRNEQDLKEYLKMVLPIIFCTEKKGEGIIEINSCKFEVKTFLEEAKEK